MRDFLIVTGLAKSGEIVHEDPPSDPSRRAVDLTALDTFIEIKRRIGTTGGNNPDPKHIQQLDEYLSESQKLGKGVRMGVLTDGRHWVLRWPEASNINTSYPYGFTLESEQFWLPLYEWLRDRVLISRIDLEPTLENIEEHFGPASPSYRRDIDTLKSLYSQHASYDTVRVKRSLWYDLLRAGLGEIARSDEQMDDLFIRHTYLSSVVGMVVQASFSIDISQLAVNDPEDLLRGVEFRGSTGLQGVVESDFFAWPGEVGGLPLMRNLAHRLARFKWTNVQPDIAAVLYETVIPPEERRQLGEYYTPDWLARAIVQEIVTDPLSQRVLDPACGSGAFLTQAISHFIKAAEKQKMPEEEIFGKLREAVTGIDIHPVAVHLARSAWVLAAKAVINASSTHIPATIPVYLGDSLQLRFRTGDMFAEREVSIEVRDGENSRLQFPRRIVNNAEKFDALMTDIATYLQSEQDPGVALDDHGIGDPKERDMLISTINTLQKLQKQGRNHIWAYYTRNLVRPVVLADERVDVIVGNPPWINYNQTIDILRTELERQSKETYNIWAGGRYATHQDVAGLFFARCVDLYLKDSGIIGMVMPHSALQTGQYSRWRSGMWRKKNGQTGMYVDFDVRTAWDLERLEPNTFFPIPASVIFAERTGQGREGKPLAGDVYQWIGETGSDDVRRVPIAITDTSKSGDSPYARYSSQGATIVPRRLFFVEESANVPIVQMADLITLNPRRSSRDKKPWRDVDLTRISNQTIESDHIFNVHLGETLAPYTTLEPLKAVLPIKHGEKSFDIADSGVAGINIGSLRMRMRDRWRIINQLWEDNKAVANKLNLFQRIDYYGNLSSQLKWRENPGDRPIRLVYTSAGSPTAAIVDDDDIIIESKLFWIRCKSLQEANYLLAIINSEGLAEAVNRYTTPNWAGKTRDLQKHLWKLPIPEFDAEDVLHMSISEAGQSAAVGAAEQLKHLYKERGQVTVTIARRELRKWLHKSDEGKAVEESVDKLLG